MSWADCVREGRKTSREAMSKIGDIATAIGRLEGLISDAHRAGFNEACDLLGAPESDTPMKRIELSKVGRGTF